MANNSKIQWTDATWSIGEALELSSRAACTKPMLAAVFFVDFQQLKK